MEKIDEIYPLDCHSEIRNLVPPDELVGKIGGWFEGVGNEFLHHFIEKCGLKSDEKVLDIGCGCGRMAIPLAGYLTPAGSYEGFDIDRDAIDWCKKNITPKFPNFHFLYVDIYNKSYNTKGTIKPNNFKFPYEDSKFDFIFLTSVFTHLMPDDMEQYFREIKRTLKKDGRCFITFFLINPVSMKLVKEKKSLLDFKYSISNSFINRIFYPHKKYWATDDLSNVDSAVGYDEKYVLELFEKNGLTIQTVIYGAWSNRPPVSGGSYQDIIIAYNK